VKGIGFGRYLAIGEEKFSTHRVCYFLKTFSSLILENGVKYK